MKTIQEYFESRCAENTDINEHLPTLKAYGEKCDHITEFGCRSGESTCALLAAKPEVLITYDINMECFYTWEKLSAMNIHGTKFLFLCDDSRTEQIEETDLLFIDTVHCYEQLIEELKQAPKVRKYIILHDTEIYGNTGERGGLGMKPAITEFLEKNENWRTEKHFANNSGLTILERMDKRRPVNE